MNKIATVFLMVMLATAASAQILNPMDTDGMMPEMDSNTNRNFNKHNNDTTATKEVPKGLYVWTVDRRFGDITPAEPDTTSHLFMNTLFNTGLHGEYNTTGNNYTARESRIVIDRPLTEQFIFTQPYSWMIRQPDRFHFTNTLSPLTNITYDNCGNKTNGEDHIDAKFAVNAGKRLGFGFDLNYAYARGYYSNQSASHFSGTLYASYLGDRYNMHAIFSKYHQKVAENGGITDDNYITHPETFDDQFSENEIPTVLSQNWNRNDNTHLFFTHRYNLGFYRMVKMTDEEIKARKFAEESKREKDEREAQKEERTSATTGRPEGAKIADGKAPTGRPEGARIAGDEADLGLKEPVDTTRVSVESQAKMDSLMAEKARQDSIDATMKREFVPVTSFIHTLDYNTYNRIYQAYETPDNYYADTFYKYNPEWTYPGDSIYDQTKMTSLRNTLGIALLEGFNKYAKAGLKVFASHELRRFELPEIMAGSNGLMATMARRNEHSVSVGGQISKTQGRTLHYNLAAETWLAGEDIGQLKIDFSTDLNFPLFGDTVTLAAKAYFYRLNPTFYQRHYHSKHLWWDRENLSKETRTRVEGLFSYRKTKTKLRVAIEEIQNYTYFGMSYDATTTGRTNMTAGVNQCGGNINLLTAQLMQNFRLGILNWENIVTYQNSSREEVLPVPALNLFTNLYIKFKIVNELAVELGGDAYFFTSYFAPDYCPQLNQFAVQQNAESKVKLGGYPFVDIYANMHLKHTRFFIMYSHINAGNGNSMYFLAPHYPQNGQILRFGLSWNFFN
ncbi:MAG: putative porin [Prevotella sp.]|nr:putative porin [Prevotella sp.]